MVEKDGTDDPVSKGRKIVKPGVPLTPAGDSGIEISETFHTCVNMQMIYVY